MLNPDSDNEDEIGFIEPVLTFKRERLSPTEYILTITVAVYRKDEKWPFSAKELEGLDLKFVVHPNELLPVIHELERYIRQFPFRDIENENIND